MSRKRAIIVGLIGFLFFAGGISFLIHGALLAADARSWVSAEGTVVRTWVYRDENRRTDDDFTPHVAYTFDVGGRTFSGDRVWLTGAQEFATQEEAAAVLALYPVGGRVEVFHDPDDPRRAALIRETKQTDIWVFSTLFGLALLLGVWFLRRRRR